MRGLCIPVTASALLTRPCPAAQRDLPHPDRPGPTTFLPPSPKLWLLSRAPDTLTRNCIHSAVTRCKSTAHFVAFARLVVVEELSASMAVGNEHRALARARSAPVATRRALANPVFTFLRPRSGQKFWEVSPVRFACPSPLGLTPPFSRARRPFPRSTVRYDGQNVFDTSVDESARGQASPTTASEPPP